MTKLGFRRGFWSKVTWSRPDSPTPSMCSCCSGALGDVPLMLFREDGAAISICDPCIEQWMELKPESQAEQQGWHSNGDDVG